MRLYDVGTHLAKIVHLKIDPKINKSIFYLSKKKKEEPLTAFDNRSKSNVAAFANPVHNEA